MDHDQAATFITIFIAYLFGSVIVVVATLIQDGYCQAAGKSSWISSKDRSLRYHYLMIAAMTWWLYIVIGILRLVFLLIEAGFMKIGYGIGKLMTGRQAKRGIEKQSMEEVEKFLHDDHSSERKKIGNQK